MSAQEIITQHLDIWTAAHKTRSSAGRGSSNKLDLYGIKKLRELILELAVRGKLVPQDPNDEPASDLLKKIEAEKQRLVKAGKIKKEKPLREVEEAERIFDLPLGWKFIRLGNFFNSIISGGTPSKNNPEFWNGDIPWASVKDLGKSRFLDKTEDYITQKGLDAGSKLAEKGDVLICTRMGLGKIGICNVPIAINQDLKALKLNSQVSLDYFLIAFSTIEMKGTGTTVAGIKQEELLNYVIALPPLIEQHRIVAKVDELMAFCDQLEQTQSDNIAAHAQLVEALLATLTNSSDHNELQNNWQRIAAHFDTLFTTEHSIDQLKQTILQLAVMGKLVPQNPNDEPASELLKKIAAEKAQLIKEGKIKKEKPLPEITDEEKPFELPSGWDCARLANISDVGTGATPSRADSSYYDPAEVNWVTSGETSEEYIRETKEKVSWKAVKETNVSIYPVGTLIIAMYGQGKTRGQVTELMIEAGTNQACAAIRLIENAVHHRKYVKLFFIKAYDELREQSAGGAQPNLNVGKVSTTVIPLPPLAEQHRIVTKVAELMALCDTLKTNLQNAQTTQLALADALVEQAVN
jgi:type I restriction enzyme, S subunit